MCKRVESLFCSLDTGHSCQFGPLWRPPEAIRGKIVQRLLLIPFHFLDLIRYWWIINRHFHVKVQYIWQLCRCDGWNLAVYFCLSSTLFWCVWRHMLGKNAKHILLEFLFLFSFVYSLFWLNNMTLLETGEVLSKNWLKLTLRAHFFICITMFVCHLFFLSFFPKSTLVVCFFWMFLT